MALRFSSLNISNTEEMRRKYRQLLFTCSKEDLAPISAVILNSETLYQKSDDGTKILDMVKDLGIVPGVTLDKGWIEMAGSGGKEVFTQGLDSLDERF